MASGSNSNEKTWWNEDIAWFINQAPAELGERGSGFGGGGGSAYVDNWPAIERMAKAAPSAARFGGLMATWKLLTARDQNVLGAYYTHRHQIVTLGAEAAFEKYATVALLVSEDRQGLCEALSNKNNSKNAPVVDRARKRAHKAVEAAHQAWDVAKRLSSTKWAEGA